MDNETDEQVAVRAQGGNTDAYAELLSRYENRLLRYVNFLIHDSSLASDVVQETFISAYQNLRSYDAKRKFSSWLYRIAHNKSIDAIQNDRHLSDTDIHELAVTAYEPTVSDMYDASLLKADVQTCIQKLNPKQKSVIQLIYFEQMSYSDASDVLHVPVPTIGTWLSRAKKNLKDICTTQGVTYDS